MSYSPQPRETLWETLSKHASTMFEHGKKLAGQAAKRVADATTPEPKTPTMMSTSVGVARTPAPMPVSPRPATMSRPATMARPATIAGGKKKGKKGKGKTAKRGKKGTKAKAKKGTRAKKGTKRK